MPNLAAGDYVGILYDAAGNRRFSGLVQTSAGVEASYNDEVLYYGADNKLRATDGFQRAGSATLQPEASRTFEEYRYDAMGRRVVVRSRRECQWSYDASCVAGVVRRTVWDGSSELFEIQMPDSATWRENDTLHVGSVWASTYGLKLQCGISAFMGRIAYVASPTVDQPLELIRLNLEAQVPNIGGLTTSCQGESYYDYFKWPGPLVYAPVYDWRGVADEGTLANGAARSYTATGEGAFAQPPWQDIVDNFNRFGVGVDQWFGEVVTQKKDGSGQMYRRNRFYDPQTGLFTQEDPAGLAGGLNAYGFADGDPINYDDPFGLCPVRGNCTQANVGPLHSPPSPDEEALQDPGILDPVALATGAAAGALDAAIEKGAATVAADMASKAATSTTKTAGVAANRAAGNAFRDAIASDFEANGYEVTKEVFKRTPFGGRFIDIQIQKDGVLLGGIETKASATARYSASQRAKDAYLKYVEGYIVNVVRPK